MSRSVKPAGALRGPGRDHAGLLADLAVDAEAHDLGEIVGGALLAQPLDHRERHRLVAREVEPQALLAAPRASSGTGSSVVSDSAAVDVELVPDAFAARHEQPVPRTVGCSVAR